MPTNPHDVAQYIRTFNEALCSRCNKEARIEGERTRYSVAEYLIRVGWSASDGELICPAHQSSEDKQ